jgi:hypothetical protein
MLRWVFEWVVRLHFHEVMAVGRGLPFPEEFRNAMEEATKGRVAIEEVE